MIIIKTRNLIITTGRKSQYNRIFINFIFSFMMKSISCTKSNLKRNNLISSLSDKVDVIYSSRVKKGVFLRISY